MAVHEMSNLPRISVSRTSSASSRAVREQHEITPEARTVPVQHVSHAWNNNGWPRRKSSGKSHDPEVEWYIKWDENSFTNGRILIIDYLSSETCAAHEFTGKRHITIRAVEIEDIAGLKRFYASGKRVQGAALRVIHVQNATWATRFLLRKFNIDHPSEILGMQGFSRWAQYEKPRQRNGRPYPNGRSWRQQTDPWRNISRTAFGLDYLKTFRTEATDRRRPQGIFGDRPIDANMMHLNSYPDSRSPQGYNVSVQRMSVYVQRRLGAPTQLSPHQNVKNPYAKFTDDGQYCKGDEDKVDLTLLDNSNTIIIFETSASMLLHDCLIQPREDFEKRWRRLSFYLRKEDVLGDSRLAAQCTNMILSDVFHGLAVAWLDFLAVATDHVGLLEDKIYENPADESRAPELWTNQAAWLKVDKIMWIHQDLVKEMQGHMHELADLEAENETQIQIDWLANTPTEYERLGHSVQEDLVQPTANLSDLMYKSVGIRDSRQSLQLGLSMWRLSWITFIFLPLTFIVSFFGMNVDIFGGDESTLPNVGWYFLAAAILMTFVLTLWYCVKHSLQRRRQTPYQRGIYEHLFHDLEDEYPQIWTNEGAADDIEPLGITGRFKWSLLRHWFAPERTVNKAISTSEIEIGELGTAASLQRYLLQRWLPTIRFTRRNSSIDTDAELGFTPASSLRTSLQMTPGAVAQLAKITTPIAIAGAEPTAVQPMSTFGLRPLSAEERRRKSSALVETAQRTSESRPSSRASSGIMIEETNLSDSESDAAEGAVASG